MSREHDSQVPRAVGLAGPLACMGEIKGDQMRCGGWGSWQRSSGARNLSQPLPEGREPCTALTHHGVKHLPEGETECDLRDAALPHHLLAVRPQACGHLDCLMTLFSSPFVSVVIPGHVSAPRVVSSPHPLPCSVT